MKTDGLAHTRLAPRGEDKYRAMLDAAPDAMVGVDCRGQIVMANVQAETLFGYGRNQLIGQPVELLVPDRVKAAHSTYRENYFDEPRSRPMGVVFNLTGRRADGTEFPADISLKSIDTEDGVVALAAIRDITERKEAEDESRRAREEADRANRAKSDFLSRMSHEFRTPLNSILGFGQVLAMDELTDVQRSSVDQILKGGEHLLDLINETLDIALIESGDIALSLEPVHVGKALDEALQLVRPIAEQQGVRVIEPSGDFDIHLRADPQRVKQVLLNLLSNALKYNQEGGEVRVTGERPKERSFRINISDTGPGIQPHRMNELFSPFERLGAEQLGIEGTGLGLALSKGLVESMDGAIGATSTVGAGSTFWVELPVSEEVVSERPQGPGLGAEAATSAAPRTILYIEDDLANLQLIQAILAHRPAITLQSAVQGGVGVELARRQLPDLILLDLHLPDMPGEEILRRLRSSDHTRSIPVVVISADASSDTSKRLLAAGATGFVAKPFNVLLFLQTVDGILA